MLSTINGFDLLLIIIITILGFKVYNLNQECESYVEQIIAVSQDNYRLSEQVHDLKYPTTNPEKCLYCLGIEEFITGNECYCPPF